MSPQKDTDLTQGEAPEAPVSDSELDDVQGGSGAPLQNVPIPTVIPDGLSC